MNHNTFTTITPIKQTLSDFIKNCPYRDHNKIKALVKQKYNVDIDDDLIDNYIPKLNNFNETESKKIYNFKIVCSPGTYLGDIFFPVGNKVAFLLLIEANTRKAYAYQLGDITEKEIINVDTEKYERQILAPKTGLKTTTSLIKAFNKFLNDDPYTVRYLKFDGESGINNTTFQTFLTKNNIKFIPVKKENINSLSLINRLCRTLRDIAFNMNIQIVDQNMMDKVLDIYNNAPHKSITKACFGYEPRLKKFYPNGISPNNVCNDGDFGICPEGIRYLERVCILQWLTMNYVKQDEIDEINLLDQCRIYEENSKFDKTKRSKLSKDIYQVIGKKNNLYQCQNIRTGEIKNIQRAFIKLI